MQTLRKLFYEKKMTWPRVLIFAAAAAFLTAGLLILPFTAGTSFENIGVTFECWILFALIIILNCEHPLEAAAKTFVFFLLSQPLIYLLQVPFCRLGWEIFDYYRRWFFWTLATFPGAFAAWFIKKQKWFSALILSVATAYLAGQGVYFFQSTAAHFPHQLLSAIFCEVLAFGLCFVLLRGKRERLIALAVTALALLVAILLFFGVFTGPEESRMTYGLDSAHTWQIEEIIPEGDGVGEISIFPDDEAALFIVATRYGSAEVHLINELGEPLRLTVSYSRRDWITITEQ